MEQLNHSEITNTLMRANQSSEQSSSSIDNTVNDKRLSEKIVIMKDITNQRMRSESNNQRMEDRSELKRESKVRKAIA